METPNNIKRRPQMPPEYYEQIKRMARQARAWVAAHPDTKAIVQFNYPPDVQVLGSVELIPTTHYVFADAAGKELIAAACDGLTDGKTPTIFMLRMALELTDHPEL